MDFSYSFILNLISNLSVGGGKTLQHVQLSVFAKLDLSFAEETFGSDLSMTLACQFFIVRKIELVIAKARTVCLTDWMII